MRYWAAVGLLLLLLLSLLVGWAFISYFLVAFAFDVHVALGWAAAVFFGLKWLLLILVIAASAISASVQ